MDKFADTNSYRFWDDLISIGTSFLDSCGDL